MVKWSDKVKVTTYELTEEERRVKKNAILQMKYTMQVRKNKLKEDLLAQKKKKKMQKTPMPNRRSMLPPDWAQRRVMKRKILLWNKPVLA